MGNGDLGQTFKKIEELMASLSLTPEDDRVLVAGVLRQTEGIEGAAGQATDG